MYLCSLPKISYFNYTSHLKTNAPEFYQSTRVVAYIKVVPHFNHEMCFHSFVYNFML